MNVLIVGDVHGCYYTLRQLIKENWNPETDYLVQVGDLINKGPHSGRCIKYWQKLEKKHPGKVYIIRGNHEQFFIDGFLADSTTKNYTELCENFTSAGLRIEKVASWLRQIPLSWENENILITHAGISTKAKDPYFIGDAQSVINNRKSITRLDKVQVVGHTVVKGEKPLFSVKENTWYIDTGACNGKSLSAVYFNNHEAEVKKSPTDPRDMN